MELLIGYSALGFISGFCFDIVVFFFGRNRLHGVLFDAILIGTPIIFALLGVFLKHYGLIFLRYFLVCSVA